VSSSASQSVAPPASASPRRLPDAVALVDRQRRYRAGHVSTGGSSMCGRTCPASPRSSTTTSGQAFCTRRRVESGTSSSPSSRHTAMARRDARRRPVDRDGRWSRRRRLNFIEENQATFGFRRERPSTTATLNAFPLEALSGPPALADLRAVRDSSSWRASGPGRAIRCTTTRPSRARLWRGRPCPPGSPRSGRGFPSQLQAS